MGSGDHLGGSKGPERSRRSPADERAEAIEWINRLQRCLRKGFQFGKDGGEIFCNLSDEYAWRAVLPYMALCIHDIQQNVNYFIASDARIAAPIMCLVSASTEILMKPCVSPFSMARFMRLSEVS